MRKYLPAALVGVGTLVFAVGVVAFAVISSNKSHSYNLAANATPGTPAPTDTGALQQSGSSLGVSSGSDAGGALQSNLGGQSAGASGSNGGASAGSGGATIPTPDQFGQYDQYKDAQNAMFSDLVVGTGTEVAANSKVAVTYQGWLTDGTLFDQSHTNDQGQLEAFTFVVGAHSVIPGWEEAITGMKVGGKRRFVVPPAAGYGAEGHDPVPPNAVLIFDVTLHDAL